MSAAATMHPHGHDQHRRRRRDGGGVPTNHGGSTPNLSRSRTNANASANNAGLIAANPIGDDGGETDATCAAHQPQQRAQRHDCPQQQRRLHPQQQQRQVQRERQPLHGNVSAPMVGVHRGDSRSNGVRDGHAATATSDYRSAAGSSSHRLRVHGTAAVAYGAIYEDGHGHGHGGEQHQHHSHTMSADGVNAVNGVDGGVNDIAPLTRTLPARRVMSGPVSVGDAVGVGMMSNRNHAAKHNRAAAPIHTSKAFSDAKAASTPHCAQPQTQARSQSQSQSHTHAQHQQQHQQHSNRNTSTPLHAHAHNNNNSSSSPPRHLTLVRAQSNQLSVTGSVASSIVSSPALAPPTTAATATATATASPEWHLQLRRQSTVTSTQSATFPSASASSASLRRSPSLFNPDGSIPMPLSRSASCSVVAQQYNRRRSSMASRSSSKRLYPAIDDFLSSTDDADNDSAYHSVMESLSKRSTRTTGTTSMAMAMPIAMAKPGDSIHSRARDSTGNFTQPTARSSTASAAGVGTSSSHHQRNRGSHAGAPVVAAAAAGEQNANDQNTNHAELGPFPPSNSDSIPAQQPTQPMQRRRSSKRLRVSVVMAQTLNNLNFGDDDDDDDDEGDEDINDDAQPIQVITTTTEQPRPAHGHSDRVNDLDARIRNTSNNANHTNANNTTFIPDADHDDDEQDDNKKMPATAADGKKVTSTALAMSTTEIQRSDDFVTFQLTPYRQQQQQQQQQQHMYQTQPQANPHAQHASTAATTATNNNSNEHPLNDDDNRIAIQMQEDLEKDREIRQRGEQMQMLSTVFGRTVLLVDELMKSIRQVQQEAPPSPQPENRPQMVGGEEMFVAWVEQFLELHQTYQDLAKPAAIDIGYHFVSSQDQYEDIKVHGISPRAVQFVANPLADDGNSNNNNPTSSTSASFIQGFDCGVPTVQNPFKCTNDFTHCIMVARLKGQMDKAQILSNNNEIQVYLLPNHANQLMTASTSTTIDSLKDQNQIVLRTSAQCIPIMAFDCSCIKDVRQYQSKFQSTINSFLEMIL